MAQGKEGPGQQAQSCCCTRAEREELLLRERQPSVVVRHPVPPSSLSVLLVHPTLELLEHLIEHPSGCAQDGRRAEQKLELYEAHLLLGR